jgi:hypothetical protein
MGLLYCCQRIGYRVRESILYFNENKQKQEKKDKKLWAVSRLKGIVDKCCFFRQHHQCVKSYEQPNKSKYIKNNEINQRNKRRQFINIQNLQI